MSSADAQEAAPKTTSALFIEQPQVEKTTATNGGAETTPDFDALNPEYEPPRERFIPVTRFALLDRLTAPMAWSSGQSRDARRFFRYLDHWRRQQYNAELHELEETYEPFSPDSDLLMTRKFTPAERQVMQRRILEGMARILEQANYVRIISTCMLISMHSRNCSSFTAELQTSATSAVGGTSSTERKNSIYRSSSGYLSCSS
jgi:hypothetical protein